MEPVNSTNLPVAFVWWLPERDYPTICAQCAWQYGLDGSNSDPIYSACDADTCQECGEQPTDHETKEA